MLRAISYGSYILFVALVYAGCAGNPFTVPVNNPEERIFYKNFSFLPPNGANWKTTKKPYEKIIEGWPMVMIVYSKPLFKNKARLPSEMQTVAAGAEIHIFSKDENINKDMLLKYKKRGWNFPQGHPRFKTIDFKYSFDDSYNTLCLRYDTKAEDRGVPGFSGSVFIFHNWGIACVHPKFKNEIYTLNAGQRYFKGVAPLSLEKEFNHLLNSIQFR